MIDLLSLVEKTQNIKLLYVEDNELVRKDTLEMLDIFFEEIIVSMNGQLGLEEYTNGTFDLILTDIQMPIMDGIEMIANIRKVDRNIPIIIISANEQEENETIDMDRTYYLQKPFMLDSLVSIINDISS